jgi:hypothetical protein
MMGVKALSAEVVHQLDDRNGAAVLLNRLAPYPEMFSNLAGTSAGCTGYFLGLLEATLGRVDAAVAHFSAAASLYEKLGAPAHLGRTQVAWARVLLSRRASGDVEEARSLLGAAVGVARERGFVVVERRAAPLLAGI